MTASKLAPPLQHALHSLASERDSEVEVRHSLPGVISQRTRKHISPFDLVDRPIG